MNTQFLSDYDGCTWPFVQNFSPWCFITSFSISPSSFRHVWRYTEEPVAWNPIKFIFPFFTFLSLFFLFFFLYIFLNVCLLDVCFLLYVFLMFLCMFLDVCFWGVKPLFTLNGNFSDSIVDVHIKLFKTPVNVWGWNFSGSSLGFLQNICWREFLSWTSQLWSGIGSNVCNYFWIERFGVEKSDNSQRVPVARQRHDLVIRVKWCIKWYNCTGTIFHLFSRKEHVEECSTSLYTSSQ